MSRHPSLGRRQQGKDSHDVLSLPWYTDQERAKQDRGPLMDWSVAVAYSFSLFLNIHRTLDVTALDYIWGTTTILPYQ